METTVLIITSIGIGIGFFIQTVVGFAATLFALPILLTVLSLQDSITCLSIFHLIFSIILISKNYKYVNKKIALEIVIGGIIGLIAGISLLKYGNSEILKIFLGLFIILYVIHATFKKRENEILKKMGIIFSLLGGFFSGLYSAGGPLFATYIYNKLSNQNAIRATLIGALLVINIFRIPLLVANELISYNIIFLSFFILPSFLISIYLGEKLHKQIKETTFKSVFLSLLLISGISLIISQV